MCITQLSACNVLIQSINCIYRKHHIVRHKQDLKLFHHSNTHDLLSYTTSQQQGFCIIVISKKCTTSTTSLTWPPTSCNRAVLTGSCSMSVLMAVWSKGQALRCNLFRHILQTVCPQPKLMGRRTVSSNVCVQIGHSRNSVHCGACTGMVIC